MNYVTHYHADFSVLTVFFLSWPNIHFGTLFSPYVPEYMTTIFPYAKCVLYNMTFEVRKVVLLRVQVIWDVKTLLDE